MKKQQIDSYILPVIGLIKEHGFEPLIFKEKDNSYYLIFTDRVIVYVIQIILVDSKADYMLGTAILSARNNRMELWYFYKPSIVSREIFDDYINEAHVIYETDQLCEVNIPSGRYENLLAQWAKENSCKYVKL